MSNESTTTSPLGSAKNPNVNVQVGAYAIHHTFSPSNAAMTAGVTVLAAGLCSIFCALIAKAVLPDNQNESAK